MPQLVDRNSAPAAKAELNLFSVPATQVAIERSYYQEFYPKNPLTTQPIRFEIPQNPAFLDVCHHKLFCKFRVTHADGTVITSLPAANPPDFAGLINYFGNTFLRQVKVYDANRLIWDSGDDYGYKAMIEVLLGADTEAKRSHLRSALFVGDTPGHMDTLGVGNDGLVARETVTRESAQFETMASLHIDLFNQERLFPNRMTLAIELFRQPNPFIFMSNRPGLVGVANRRYKLELLECKLMMRMVETTPSLTLAFEKQLMKTPAKIPIKRSEISVMHLDAGRSDLPQRHIYTGQLPRRVIIAMVQHGAYHGSYATNPFNFQNFGVEEVQLTAAGKQYPPMPLRMDFANNQYMQAFHMIYDAMGSPTGEHGCGITYEQFKEGYTLLCFDLSADSSASSGYFQLVNDGTMELQIRFTNPIANATGVKIIIYKEFDNILNIDRFRACHMDYTI